MLTAEYIGLLGSGLLFNVVTKLGLSITVFSCWKGQTVFIHISKQQTLASWPLTPISTVPEYVTYVII